LGPWQDDPFGLFSSWVQARAQETPVRPRCGRLFVSDARRDYVVIPINLRSSLTLTARSIIRVGA